MAFTKFFTIRVAAGIACLASFAPLAQAASLADPASAQPSAQATLAVASVDSIAASSSGPLGSARSPRLALEDDAWLPTVRADMNEQVLHIPVDGNGSVTLETTIYRPDGPGPFPMIVFNHGKLPGDPRNQSRADPVSFAREFVSRGYVVVAPNREGFAGSGGTYQQDGCDVEANGLGQATDVAATIDYMSKQPYVDANHIAVAGTSHGGLTTIAYGTEASKGVRALINFSGGLRQDFCSGWQKNLTDAFGTYGAKARVASLWLYGDNDSVWTPSLEAKMFSAYKTAAASDADADAKAAASATFVDYGSYKNDAHRLVGDSDGVKVWWPAVEAFLARQGMPTAVQYRVAAPVAPKGTGFAAIDAVSAVPYLDQSGRDGYRNFLKQYPSRAFAVSSSGAWSWAEGGDNPMAVAIANCQKHSSDACHLYAVNGNVVWSEDPAVVARNDAAAVPSNADSDAGHAIASR